MAESTQIVFSHQEVVTALIKQQGIHKDLWGIYVEFGLGAANVSTGPDDPNYLPAAVIPVMKIGIQRFTVPSNLTVDAAVVNPIRDGDSPGK